LAAVGLDGRPNSPVHGPAISDKPACQHSERGESGRLSFAGSECEGSRATKAECPGAYKKRWTMKSQAGGMMSFQRKKEKNVVPSPRPSLPEDHKCGDDGDYVARLCAPRLETMFLLANGVPQAK